MCALCVRIYVHNVTKACVVCWLFVCIVMCLLYTIYVHLCVPCSRCVGTYVYCMMLCVIYIMCCVYAHCLFTYCASYMCLVLCMHVMFM